MMVLQALLLLLAAFIVAGIARWLVKKLLSKTKLQEVEEKADTTAVGAPKTSVKKKMSLGNFIANLVYFIVFMLFVPGIFSSLGVIGVSEPITAFLTTILNYLPNVIGAVIVLAVGILIASLVRMLLVPVFEKIKINKLQEKAGMEVTDEGKLSQTLAFIVYVLIIIPVVIMALDVLNIDVISVPAQAMLSTVIGFIPNIVAALVLIWIGILIGKFAGALVTRLIASSGIDKKIRGMIGEDKFPKFVFSAAVGPS
jgi:small-conductance mechanosensitive channel